MVRIPEEYQEVEYIESTGTQYLSLGLPSARADLIGTSLEVVFSSQGRSSSTYNNVDVVFGFSTSGAWFGLSKENYYTIGDATFSAQMDAAIHTAVLSIENSSLNSATLDSERFERTISSHRAEAGWLFGGGTGTKWWYSCTRIYSATYKDDEGNILADFIPCYRKSDNEIGMYDTISKTFYTNAGTETFLKGHNIYYDDVNLLEIRRQMIMYKKDYLKNIEWTQGFYLYFQNFVTHSNAHYSDFIKVTPEKTFILKGYAYSTNLYDRIQGYDKEKKFQKILYKLDWPRGKFSSTIKIPSDCFYIRISTEKSTELHMYNI